MRSPLMATCYDKLPVVAFGKCRGRRLLTSRALRDCSRRVRNRKLSGALPAQPHEYARRIDPKKWRHLAGHFQRFIALQTLQSLDVKHAVINFSIGPAVAMDALALKKILPLHKGVPSLAPHRAS